MLFFRLLVLGGDWYYFWLWVGWGMLCGGVLCKDYLVDNSIVMGSVYRYLLGILENRNEFF